MSTVNLTDAEILSQFRDFMARQGGGPATFEPLKNHPLHRGVIDAGFVRPAPREFPKMVYGPANITKIVQSREEQDALGPLYKEVPSVIRGDWKAKLNEAFTKSGFRVYQHHLEFLQANNVPVTTLQDSAAFLDTLDSAQQESFFIEAEQSVEPVKEETPAPKGKGRKAA